MSELERRPDPRMSNPSLRSRLLGGTADLLGDELEQWAERRVANIKRVLDKGERRLGEDGLNRPGQVPPRVLKGILDEGSFCEDELTADYLGGVLASSRSEISRDDRAASMTAIIGRLSTYTLRGHYILYSNAQRLIAEREPFLLGIADERHRQTRFYMPVLEWLQALQLSTAEVESTRAIMAHVFTALGREDLIADQYAYGEPEVIAKHTPGKALPDGNGIIYELSLLGIELFTTGHGMRDYAHDAFFGPIEGFECEVAIPSCPGCIRLIDLPAKTA